MFTLSDLWKKIKLVKPSKVQTSPPEEEESLVPQETQKPASEPHTQELPPLTQEEAFFEKVLRELYLEPKFDEKIFQKYLEAAQYWEKNNHQLAGAYRNSLSGMESKEYYETLISTLIKVNATFAKPLIAYTKDPNSPNSMKRFLESYNHLCELLLSFILLYNNRRETLNNLQ